MDDASTATLGRALLRLGRAGATGWLHVAGRDRGAIAIRDGKPVSIRCRDGKDTLGDLIAGDERAREALARGFDGPVGREAVVRGVASVGAVSDALRRQMRGRLARWFAEPIRSVRFVEGKVGRAPFEEPPSADDLVLASLRRVLADRSVDDLDGLRSRSFVLSPHAEALRGAALAPWESAMLARARQASGGRGVRGSQLLLLAGDEERGLRTLHGWYVLGWLTRVDVGRRDHSMLLRKRHQLRRRATPSRLLEMAPAERNRPRSALRRLAAQVHPDRFEEDLAETSQEVMRALVAAAEALGSK
ncbi:MAG: hypothetical protein JJ863_26985 [Deltaproteobacteria bacterium]|nr:hypothetical protein [Deltaproteobacteria bacterium]